MVEPRDKKITILVDKVMQPQEDWRTKEWMIRETAEAGFSAFSPRKGHEDLQEVRQVADWCQKYGLLHLPWMMGTLKAPEEVSRGKRLTWSDGLEQPLWSPNSEEFWEWTRRYVVEYSKISRKCPSLIGVFLDYENYAPGKPRRDGNCYPLSYDEEILMKFGEHVGAKFPDLKPSQRANWLEKEGIDKAFAKYQIDHWKRKCRGLREEVDKYNPGFIFCIYPAPGTLFMREACYHEWATEEAPIILADATTYGRKSRFETQEQSLLENRRKLLDRIQFPKRAGIPYTYIGGIDPVVIGADPEFCGKNALSISQATQGYWVFYEGPEYEKDHPDYFKWFSWANAAIADERMDLWRGSRSTPDEWRIALFNDESGGIIAEAPTADRYTSSTPLEFLFGSTIMLGAKNGQRVLVKIFTRPITGGKDEEGIVTWEARDPSLTRMAQGQITTSGTSTINFTATTDGIHLLHLGSEEYSYGIAASNAIIGLYVGRRLTFKDGTGRLFFRVQRDLGDFSVIARGSRNWTGLLRTYDPEGNLASEGKSPGLKKKIRLETKVEERLGIWSLEATKEGDDPHEYVSLQFLSPPTLLPVLALRPEDVYSKRSI